MTDYWMKLHFLLQGELEQLEQEGCDVSDFRAEVAGLTEDIPQGAMLALYDRLSQLRPVPAFPYVEPSDLEGIRQVRAQSTLLPAPQLPEETLKDHILGAWLGRCAGCTLGKPVEGFTQAQIEAYLKAAGAYPLADYIPLLDSPPDGILLHPSFVDTVRGRINYMSRDDDTDYTIIGLHVLEKYGPNFTSQDVGEAWQNMLPYNMVFTAERIAYRNLVNELPIPQTASFRNPFREWIGAQIRADGFAYAAAGRPRLAAELAFRDAAISHVKNGIYGEMLAAAMIAKAFTTRDVYQIIQAGLAEIPQKSRLAEAMRQVLAWKEECPTWTKAFAKVSQAYSKYFWVHTVNNAAVVLIALLYGEGDLAKSISIAVMAGWDTDCNGATVGSILGAMLGAKALPQAWVGQFNDTMHSAVFGFDLARISDLAQRSWKTYLAAMGG
jgi:ADP-ribosylglycohydrolase